MSEQKSEATQVDESQVQDFDFDALADDVLGLDTEAATQESEEATEKLEGEDPHTDEDADEEIRIGVPAGLRILMRLEAFATWHLEVNFIFEKRRLFTQKLADRRDQTICELWQTFMKRRHIFNSIDQIFMAIQKAGLMIDPLGANFFRARRNFACPCTDRVNFRVLKCIIQCQKSLVAELAYLVVR